MGQFSFLLIATFEIFDNLSGFLSRLVEHNQFSFFFVCHFEIGYTFLKIIHNRIYEITNQKGWGQSAKLQQLVDHFPSDQ